MLTHLQMMLLLSVITIMWKYIIIYNFHLHFFSEAYFLPLIKYLQYFYKPNLKNLNTLCQYNRHKLRDKL